MRFHFVFKNLNIKTHFYIFHEKKEKNLLNQNKISN